MKNTPERALAGKMIEVLQARGFKTYQEVIGFPGGSSRRADIVYTEDDGSVHVIECKADLGIVAIAQALLWRPIAASCSVAILQSYDRKNLRATEAQKLARTLLIRLCDSEGVGLYFVDPLQVNDDFAVRQTVRHRCRKMLDAEIDHWSGVLANQGDRGDAGTSSGGNYYTPFRATLERIHKYVSENGPTKIKPLLKAVGHHYASDAVAVKSLTKLARTDVLKGVTIRADGLVEVVPDNPQENSCDNATQ